MEDSIVKTDLYGCNGRLSERHGDQMERTKFAEQNYTEEIVGVIRSGLDKEQLLDKLRDYHENDLAQSLEFLTKEERISLYRLLGTEWTSNIFSYLEEPDVYIRELSIDQLASLVNEMDSDDAVDVLDELDDLIQEKLVGLMDEESSHDIKMIQSYDIKKPSGSIHPAPPPGKAFLFHSLPVINGISPFLSVIRKGIRRTACHYRRSSFLI